MIGTTNLIQQIDLLTRNMMDGRWNCVYLRMLELNKFLLEVALNKSLFYVIRSDFHQSMNCLPSDLAYLQGLSTQSEFNMDVRFIIENL